MPVTADERTSTFGNFHVVTGAYTGGGGSIDLSGQFDVVLNITAHGDAAVALADLPRCSVVPATVVATITSAAGAQTGRWVAIGRR